MLSSKRDDLDLNGDNENDRWSLHVKGRVGTDPRVCTWIPAPSLTWILQRQLRLFGYGSGKPGDRIVPRRSVKLPLQGTRQKISFFPSKFD